MPRANRGNGKKLSLRNRTVSRAGAPPTTTTEQATLSETLDRVLARGVVVSAEVVLSVAEIPLVYVGLQALVSSVETVAGLMAEQSERAPRSGG